MYQISYTALSSRKTCNYAKNQWSEGSESFAWQLVILCAAGAQFSKMIFLNSGCTLSQMKEISLWYANNVQFMQRGNLISQSKKSHGSC